MDDCPDHFDSTPCELLQMGLWATTTLPSQTLLHDSREVLACSSHRGQLSGSNNAWRSVKDPIKSNTPRLVFHPSSIEEQKHATPAMKT